MVDITQRLFAASLCVIAAVAAAASEPSRPIVDVRIDGAYNQVLPSRGDEWAPTWGRDDILYTGNDDGNSFGGVLHNSIAFGKLVGNDPYALEGTTVNGMAEYRARPILGPEGAVWRRLDTFVIDKVLYRFGACAPVAGRTASACLETSADDGKTWVSGGHVGPEGFFFIAYRKQFEFSYSPDYAYAAAHAGRIDGEDNYIVGRMLKTKLAARNSADWFFQQSDGSWKPNLETATANTNSAQLGPDGANWKTMNTYSVDGVLYMFVTRCVYPFGSNDPKRRHIFQHSSIIKSTDDGKTWTRAAQENFDKPMFPGQRFGTAYFVWYGKDGVASVHNADRYVYAVSNNGFFENADNFVLGRVLRSKLPNLNAADWSFYTGGDGMQEVSWTSKIDTARPILVNPARLGMTGMTYIESLRRYVMVPWRYAQENFEAGIKAQDLSTTLEFYEAPKPWGPWTSVKQIHTRKLGWYAPIVGQRFQSAKGSDAAQVFLYVTGLYTRPEGGLDLSLYKFTYLPLTFSTEPLQHKDPAYVGGK